MIKSPVTVFFRGVNRDDDGVHVGIAGDVVDVCSIPKRWVVRSLEDSPDKSVAEMCIRDSMLIERIGKCFPNHSVLGEESGEHDAHSDYLWVVDPLDGTNNYSQGLPVICVSIGLQYRGETLSLIHIWGCWGLR